MVFGMWSAGSSFRTLASSIVFVSLILVARQTRAEYAECGIATKSATISLSVGGTVALVLGIGSGLHLSHGDDNSGIRLALGVSLLGNAAGMAGGLGFSHAWAGSQMCTHEEYGNPAYKPLAIAGWAVVAVGAIMGIVDLVTYIRGRMQVAVVPLVIQTGERDILPGLGVVGKF